MGIEETMWENDGCISREIKKISKKKKKLMKFSIVEYKKCKFWCIYMGLKRRRMKWG